MSQLPNDGGPAFPNHPTVSNYGCPGMSLRDYFAGQAMAAMLSIENVHYNAGESQIARWAYEQADAMLAQRSINPQAAVEAQQISAGVPQ